MDPEYERLQAWRDGDADAGRKLFEELFEGLFAFFQNKCRDPEDLVQQTLLGCLESSDRFDQRCSFRVFVYSIAKNQLYSYWRKQSGVRREIDIGSMSLEALQPTPSVIVAGRQERRQIAAALRMVALEDQVLLESYYWQRLTAPELAQMMGVAEPAIRSRLRRALARVRAAVAQAQPLSDARATLESLDDWAQQLGDRSPDSPKP